MIRKRGLMGHALHQGQRHVGANGHHLNGPAICIDLHRDGGFTDAQDDLPCNPCLPLGRGQRLAGQQQDDNQEQAKQIRHGGTLKRPATACINYLSSLQI